MRTLNGKDHLVMTIDTEASTIRWGQCTRESGQEDHGPNMREASTSTC